MAVGAVQCEGLGVVNDAFDHRCSDGLVAESVAPRGRTAGCW